MMWLALWLVCSLPLAFAWPFSARGDVAPKHSAAYATYLNHFSAPRSGTSAFLQAQFASLYANETIVVTTDGNFRPLQYAAVSESGLKITEDETMPSLKQVGFRSASSRRDENGALVEGVIFAGYKLEYGGAKLRAVFAEWSEGFQNVRQWHLIGDEQASKALIHSCAAYLTTVRDSILVFNGFWQQDHELWKAVQKASWEDVILEKEMKKRIMHDYRSFFESEDVYKRYNVPWKRGLILLGPAGNGKTISLKAVMHEIKVPILYVKTFTTYARDEFGIRQIFTRARAEAPCLLVLEDLDSLITDENRSFFLNEVDGIEDNDGLLLIGTTNHFEKLDPSLSNRPSRFDRKYEFPNPSKEERRQYAIYWQRKLGEEVDFPDSLLDDVAEKTDGFSFAYLKEAFVSTLLIIAQRDSDQVEKPSFRSILFEQIDFLRKQIEAGEKLSSRPLGTIRRSRKGSAFRLQEATPIMNLFGQSSGETCVKEMHRL